jgi:hypothetical protein
MTASIIYYTDNQLREPIATTVREQLLKISQERNLPIVSASLEPLDFGENHHVQMKRGYEAMFTQILTCLENAKTDLVYFCEADVLYHPSHFDWQPDNLKQWWYNQNWYKIGKGDLAVHWDADQVSGIVVGRETALEYYKQRLAEFDPNNFDRKFEPLSGEGSFSWKSDFPNIDIRHNHNLTYNKWSLSDFRNKATAVNFTQTTIDKIPGWDKNELQQILL